jgi:hypothetical protein
MKESLPADEVVRALEQHVDLSDETPAVSERGFYQRVLLHVAGSNPSSVFVEHDDHPTRIESWWLPIRGAVSAFVGSP